jgi:hypothetical protein
MAGQHFEDELGLAYLSSTFAPLGRQGNFKLQLSKKPIFQGDVKRNGLLITKCIHLQRKVEHFVVFDSMAMAGTLLLVGK